MSDPVVRGLVAAYATGAVFVTLLFWWIAFSRGTPWRRHPWPSWLFFIVFAIIAAPLVGLFWPAVAVFGAHALKESETMPESETTDPVLAVWDFDNVYKVVAYSSDDAFEVMAETQGIHRDKDFDCPDEGWERCPDDKVISIIDDVEKSEQTTTTKTCLEWAASNGRGFLGASEW